ncbi:hypothetical protein ANCCAN_03860 [Ancylostoma caninum]|uniref:Uncharacterized protein n=1 Tax=Ancylostoma caninum TaxID=29170 RepID=A0A368H085_ANCCA|nr:hypothetical protein ANCCAN_03860 [Ancylostoma caninum]
MPNAAMNTLYQHEADENIGHVCVKASPDTETTADPKQVAQFKCNCHYLWLREVHGLYALMMVSSCSSLKKPFLQDM